MLVQDIRRPRINSSDGHANQKPAVIRDSSWIRFIAVFSSYCVIALISIYPTILHGPTRWLQSSGTGDPSQEVWFVEFAPWAILHGHNPFITNWISAPHGANLLANTSFILPSILASPITLLLGPIAGFNFLMIAAFTLSAYSMYFVVSHWVAWRPAAYVAGLLYGFSPFMVGQGLGHVFLVFEPFPPLILYEFYRGVIAGVDRPRHSGILLGLLLAAQFFVSTEVLAALGVIGIIGTVLFLVVYKRGLNWIVGRTVRVAGYAILSFSVVCIVPLMLLFFGPNHYSGPAQSVNSLGVFNSDLFSLVIPNGLQAIRPIFIHPLYDNFAETDMYIGVPLLALLVVSCVRMWKRRGVRLFAYVALAAWVLSLGSRLRIYRHATSIRLPFAILAHLPFSDSFVPARLSLFTYLFAAPILAIGLDGLRRTISRRSSLFRGSSIALVAALVALFPLVPKWPYPLGGLYVPRFITSSAEREIPPDSIVVTYPFPNILTTTPMSWQALDAMRYKLVGGEMITPGKSGKATFAGMDSDLQKISVMAYAGIPLPRFTPSLIQMVRMDLRVCGADTIIVAPMGKNASAVRDLYQEALGVAGSDYQGTYVWFDAYRSLIRALDGHPL
jgi:hypothetical protein